MPTIRLKALIDILDEDIEFQIFFNDLTPIMLGAKMYYTKDDLLKTQAFKDYAFYFVKELSFALIEEDKLIISITKERSW